MRLEASTSISAPPERVWETIIDVERWPEWTQSMTRLERLDPGELKIGSRVRIKQPRFPGAVWTVTALAPGAFPEWQNRSPGASSVAIHRVEPQAGGSQVTLGISQSGVFFALTGWLFNGISRRYVKHGARRPQAPV